MLRRSLRRSGSLLAFVFAGASPASSAIDLVGASAATFEWQPAAGPVAGYVVYQHCEETGGTLARNVATNRATLESTLCAAFRVQVAAFGADGAGQPGPLSDASELVRFVAATPPPAPLPAPPDESSGEAPAGATRTFFDLDADGRLDLLMQQADTGELERWSLRYAQLRFASKLPALPPGARIVGGGDHDGDGFSDLLAIEGGQVFVWLMRDATPVGGGLLGDDLGETGSVEGSGDYDGDGVADVLIRLPAQGRIDVWSLRGGAIAASDTLAVDPGAEWRILGSGDHDGDGRSDVLWQNTVDGALVLWRSLARGDFETLLLPAALSGPWQGVGVADFDGDGTSDVAWRERDTGAVALSRFVAGRIVETVVLDAVGTAPAREIVGTGDFDADGSADLLVRGTGKPWLRLWRLHGSTLLSRTRVANLPSGWHPVVLGDESPSGRRAQP